jgi:hypothetical protein
MKNRQPAFTWFEPRSESARNWLALGLLLAAWNFSDNEAVRKQAAKPHGLQHHALITARSLRAHE